MADEAPLGLRASRGLAWNLLGEGISQGLGFILLVMVARSLGPAELGSYSVLMATVALLLVASSLSLEEGVIRFLPELRARGGEPRLRGLLRRLLAIRLCLAVALAAALVALGPLAGAALLGSAGGSLELYLLGGYFALASLGNLFGSLMEAHYSQATLNAGRMLRAFVRLGAFVALNQSLPGLTAIVVALLLGEASWALATLPRSLAVFRGDARYAPGEVGTVLSFASTLWIATMGVLILGKQSDLLLLGMLAERREVGYYNVAYTFALASVALVAVPLGKIPLATAAELHVQGGSEALGRWSHFFFSYHLVLLIPMVLAVLVLADPLVVTLFGPPYAPAVPLLRLFMVLLAADRLLGGLVGTLLPVVNRVRSLVYCNAFAVVNLLLALVLIPSWGPLGALTATGASLLASQGFLMARLRGAVVLQFPWPLLMKCMAAGSVMTLVLLVGLAWGPVSPLTLLPPGAVAYAFVLRYLRPFPRASLDALFLHRVPGGALLLQIVCRREAKH